MCVVNVGLSGALTFGANMCVHDHRKCVYVCVGMPVGLDTLSLMGRR